MRSSLTGKDGRPRPSYQLKDASARRNSVTANVKIDPEEAMIKIRRILGRYGETFDFELRENAARFQDGTRVWIDEVIY